MQGTCSGDAAFPPMALADDIRSVRGHVQVGRRHLAQQRERIAHLEGLELPTADAYEFLELLESMQDLHEMHLSRLLAKAANTVA
ncbi:MAG: hypothetical protein EOS75_05345 [Mesorhizobium sp.]|nr:MAG: hypothetical protein EOS74_29210 [Mesorhizobium sp.]RWD59130.1 MAG: hypothetical protein EOS75_05345 [Mesorhizobium sp.]